MKTRIFAVSWILAVFAMAGGAMAGTMKTIHVELSYPGPAASYTLYKDGAVACFSNTPDATQMDCDVEIGTEPITFTLTAVDSNGVESPSSAPYVLTPPAIDAATGNYLPTAVLLTSATAGEVPLLVSFDASGSSDFDGIVVSHGWDFGDGVTGSGAIIDHTFTAPGIYTVTLTVEDDHGATVDTTTTATVSQPAGGTNTPPVAHFTAAQVQGGAALLVFDATASTDPDGAIVSYAWDFGDGDIASGVTVEHEFLNIGDYTVRLTVTDAQGATSTDQMAISIVEPPKSVNALPVAGISVSTQKRLLHFEWEYLGVESGLAGFRVYQNGHKVCEVTDPAVRKADCLDYVDNGQVHFWVTAADQSGGESAASGSVTFDSTGLLPLAGGTVASAMHFSAGTSFDPDGAIVAYAWNFGDGSISEGMAVDHAFPAPGEYSVTLKVTDSNGVQSQAAVNITVAAMSSPGAPALAISQVMAATAYDASSGSGYSVQAKVSGADKGTVWATIKPATTTPPPISGGLAKVDAQGPTMTLIDADQNGVKDGVFVGSYSGFVANGVYDVVIFASDGSGKTTQSAVQTLTVSGASGTNNALLAGSGWSLLSSAIGFQVTDVFGDAQKFTSVWKWQGSTWAVYLPGESTPGAYAASKNFGVLTTINSGEGFWVNSQGETQVTVSGSPLYGPLAITAGWNLLGLKSDQASAVAEVTSGQSGIASVWKWENGTWAVYLPAEVNQGAYAASKSFGILTTINPGEGFWVNKP